MRLSVVEMSEDETIFYNLGVFREHEDLIVFPMHEFQNFYEEMEHRVRCIKNIVGMKVKYSRIQPTQLGISNLISNYWNVN